MICCKEPQLDTAKFLWVSLLGIDLFCEWCIPATDLSMACRMHTMIQLGIMGTAAVKFLTHTLLRKLGMSSSVNVLFS